MLGKAGKLKGEEIVEICLAQPACPKFIIRKLLRFLVSDTLVASDELIAPLADQFAHAYDFGKLVETVLRSNLFFSPYAYRQQIKSPVDFALGMVRGLELRVSATALATALEALGQNLFAPPSVKGWDGGQSWLNGQTLLFRQNLALSLCSRDARYVRRPEPESIAEPSDLLRKHGQSEGDRPAAFLLDLFLQGDVPSETRRKLNDYVNDADSDRHPTRALCHLVLTLPEFQLD